ncbi:unnamed protein product [Sphagnum jensenii]|uniref:Nodulin-like domain-containing protein n=1 Tax=Sphagnum jensenii TaxID=128206 RepID=A0ABP1BHZ3_9BRYO
MGRCWELARQVVTSRWFVVAVGIWIQSTGGTSYCFGIYSQSLKIAMGYDQETLNTIAVFKTLGASVGIVSGLVYDVAPPWLVLAIGAVQSVFGYLMMWLAVTARIAPPPLWQMCAFMCVATNSATFFTTAVVVTCVKNFPNNRGMVIGLMKGFVGLGAAIMTQLFYGLHPSDPKSFLLMAACLPASVSLLFMAVIRPIPASEDLVQDQEAGGNFKLFSLVSILLAVYLMGVIVLQNVVLIGSSAVSLVICVVILSLLFLHFGVVINLEIKTYNDQLRLKEPLLNAHESWRSNSLPGSPFGPAVDREFSTVDVAFAGAEYSRKTPQRGEEHTVMEAFVSFDFWLLLMIMICSMGSGTTAMDNMGQIGLSLGYTQVQISTLVSLLSIWNFLGRFGGGYISELVLHSKDIPRTFCLALSLAILCGGHLVMASAFPGSLYVGSIIVGLCYGAQWTLMPAITSEIFGFSHFGTLFNTLGVASPVGAYVLSVKVAGYLYDIETKKEHDVHQMERKVIIMGSGDPGPLLCHGAHCFRLTFIILACVCLFGCFISWFLLIRTRHLYNHIHQKLQSGNHVQSLP